MSQAADVPSMESLFTGQDPKADTDADFDQMLEQALRSKPTTHTHPPDTTRSAREFTLEHGWPLPRPERGKWRRCVLVIIGAVLATLLLGWLLENLKAADQQPTDAKLDLSAIAALVTEDSDSAEPEGSSVEATGPVFVDPFADWAPRAVLEKLPAPRAQLVALPVRRAEVVRLPR
jgi:hypothetical protein